MADEKEELKINFEEVIWPDLKNLFNLKSMPAQCLYILLQKIKEYNFVLLENNLPDM